MYKLYCRVFFMIIATIGISTSVPDGTYELPAGYT
jgi:hypothetical protein